MINRINQAIGAAGLVNEECKKAVKHFGNQIFDMLAGTVNNSVIFIHNNNLIVCFNILLSALLILQYRLHNQSRYAPVLESVLVKEMAMIGQISKPSSWFSILCNFLSFLFLCFTRVPFSICGKCKYSLMNGFDSIYP